MAVGSWKGWKGKRGHGFMPPRLRAYINRKRRRRR